MATKKRKIILLATILMIFSVSLYLQNAQKLKRRQSQRTAAQAAPKDRSPSKIANNRGNLLESLSTWDEETITKITLENHKQDSLLELAKMEEQRWQLQFPEDVPVRPGAENDLAYNALKLWGRKLPVRFDLSEQVAQERYGFHQVRLTLSYFTGEPAARVLVGGAVPGLGGYYATAVSAGDSAGALFHLSQASVERLAVDANALRKKTLPTLVLLSNRQEHLNVLELRGGGANVLRIEHKGEARENSTLNELQSFMMTKPYPTVEGVDQYRLEQLLKNLPNPIPILRYIEDQPKNLSVYGLAKEQRKRIYVLDSKGQRLDLWLGGEAGIDSVYAMESPYDSVFTVSKEVLRVLEFEPFLLVDKFLALINIDKIDRVSLADQRAGTRRNPRNYGLQILQQIPQEKEPRDREATEVSGGKLQAEGRVQNLSEEVTKDLYQQFLSLFFVGE
ncbi:MAG: DUF4340 domain-containing protein, partial [Spirochaetota bacterium]